jgi:pimeloyl-ACP methyl ester carboxylesterase
MSLRAPSVAEVGSAPSPTLSRTVEDLISAIDSLGFSDYGFCGVSLGASIGLALAASDPRLKHLIVGSTLPYIPPLSQWTDRAEALEALGALESIVEPTLRRWLSHEFRQLEPVATQEIRSMLATQSLHDYGFACRVASTIDLRERLPAVNAAVTWIIGSEDAATLPSEQARAAKRLPDCTAIVVEGAAHLVPFERPSAFNEAIRSIVNQA